MAPRPSSVTLHSSWRGLVLGAIGAAIVASAGLYSTVRTGGAIGSILLLFAGAALSAVVLFDLPVSSRFDRDGVQRRPIGRRQFIRWEQVDQLTRARPGIAALARDLAPGGLVAKVGRRRYLLVDQCESLDEYHRLIALLEDDDGEDPLGLDELIMPRADVDPTWTYRRTKWQPQPDSSD